MDLTNVVFDGKHRKLVFHGNCTEMLSVCEAMCCRDWAVGMSAEEYASGIYDSEIICTLTDKTCRDTLSICTSRRYRLKKKEDGSCIYLKDNRCSIYAERPKVCRDFVCSVGWKLDSVFSHEGKTLVNNPDISIKKTFVERLTDDLTFVLHPLIKVHAVFYRKSHRDIIFLKEMVGGRCGKFNTQDHFNYPQLDDAKIMRLIDLFNRKEPLKSIFQTCCSEYPNLVTQKDFFEIIWLLNKHNIVLDSSNFTGMLRGMGGLG